MKDCYGKKGTFNKDKLNNHLNNFRQKYGHNQSLVNVVSSLVETDEAARPDTNLMLNRRQANYVNAPPPQQEVQPEEEIIGFNNRRNDNNVQSSGPPVAPPPVERVEVVKETPQPVTKVVETQPVENVVEGDDFFSNPTPTYYQPQGEYVPNQQYEPAQTFQAPVKQTYVQPVTYEQPVVYEQPVQTYQRPATTTYTEVKASQPSVTSSNTEGSVTYGKPRVVRTYVDHSSRRSFKNESQTPSTTVVHSTPNTTYVQSTPQRVVVSNEPVETVTEYRPPATTIVTRVEAAPSSDFKKKSAVFQDATFEENVDMEYQDQPYQGQTETYVQSAPQPVVVSNQAPPQGGRVVRRTVVVRDAEGNVLEQYEEPVN